MMNFDMQNSLNRYQTMIARVYALGVVLMIAFNAGCYPGTFIGLFGWAIVWPLYVPAVLVRLFVWGGGITWAGVCPVG